MVPARFAVAMIEHKWYLRSEIIWEKPSCKPEKADDRPSATHEKVYMFTKSQRYKYDKETAASIGAHRTVWRINPSQGAVTMDGEPVPAAFPEELVERCLLPSTEPGDRVLDPFAGSGTTVAVAEQWGRVGVGTDLTDRWFPPHRSRSAPGPDHQDQGVQLVFP